MRHIVTFLSICIMLLSCSSDRKIEYVYTTPTLPVSAGSVTCFDVAGQSEPGDIYDMIDSIRVIEPETRAGCLIGHVSRVRLMTDS